MFCIKCGRKLDEGSSFCSYCGAQVMQSPQTAAAGGDIYGEDDTVLMEQLRNQKAPGQEDYSRTVPEQEDYSGTAPGQEPYSQTAPGQESIPEETVPDWLRELQHQEELQMPAYFARRDAEASGEPNYGGFLEREPEKAPERTWSRGLTVAWSVTGVLILGAIASIAGVIWVKLF